VISLGLVFGSAGCGRIQNAAQQSRSMNDLKLIGIWYHNYHAATNKGPEKAEDLKGYAADDPKVYQALVDGKFVFIYGVKLADMTAGSSNTVLAYEAEAPTKGGAVLFGDGSVRRLSAQEFQGATKAQKAAS
jgi:hypothetical protein